MSGVNPDHLYLLRAEMARLAEVTADHLDLSLPHLEGWTVRDVIGHTGWTSRYVTQALSAAPEEPPSRADVPEPPPGAEVLAWFDEAQRLLIDALEAVDTERECPTWTGPQPASWWIRRMAHEASMHRWDAYSASGSPAAIDPRLARDGIDEVLEVFAPHRIQFDVLDAAGSTIHLHATDIDDGEWMITIGEDSLTFEHGHAKADVAARGPVSDLLLLLWSRIPPSRLEVFGDAALLDRWQEAATF